MTTTTKKKVMMMRMMKMMRKEEEQQQQQKAKEEEERQDVWLGKKKSEGVQTMQTRSQRAKVPCRPKRMPEQKT